MAVPPAAFSICGRTVAVTTDPGPSPSASGSPSPSPPLWRPRVGCPAPHGGARRRTNVVVRAEPQDPMEALLSSKMLRSEVVMREFSSVFDTMMQLAKMSTRFADFDIAGKRMYIDQMEANCGRYEVFIKRLELSEEPAVKEFLRATNAQMMNGGFSLPQMVAGFKTSLEQYRGLVEAEERAAVDPHTHAAFKQKMKAAWSRTSLGRFDMEYLKDITDPEIVMRARKDPQFWKAMREISEDPDPAVLRKWMDEPGALGPFIAEIWKSMQNRQFKEGN